MNATPEIKALIGRRTLTGSIMATCLCARGNGVTDERLKLLILAMRSPEIAVLTDDEAMGLVHHLEIAEA